MLRAMRWSGILWLPLLFAACDSPIVRVGKLVLPLADAADAVPDGALVELPVSGTPLPAVPAGAKVVQIAADDHTPWSAVMSYALAVQAAGARPVLLVAYHNGRGVVPPTAEAIEDSILLEATTETKWCISPPHADERLCAERPDGQHVDRASVRGLVRDAVKGYALDHVHVRLDPALSWADAMRVIDGARTCCQQKITVSVEGLLLD